MRATPIAVLWAMTLGLLAMWAEFWRLGMWDQMMYVAFDIAIILVVLWSEHRGGEEIAVVHPVDKQARER